MQNAARHGYAPADDPAAALKPLTVYWQWVLMNAVIWFGMSLFGGGTILTFGLWVGTWGALAGIFIMTAFVGLMQGAVVHSRLPRLRWWHWPAAQCVATVFVLARIAPWTSPLDNALDHVYELYAVAGLAAGVCQWFVLRRYADRAYWWILANPAAALAGTGTIALSLPIEPLVSTLLGGAVAGAIHGIVLAWVIQPRDY